jgi:hypothetical protein
VTSQPTKGWFVRGRRWWAAALVGALVTAGCSDDGENASTDTTVAEEESAFAGSIDLAVSNADRCDPIAPGCLFPFPNDAFTVPDDTTATGRRVAFARESLPANAQGVHVDPAQFEGLDGFSPGAAILFQLPDLDLEASGVAPVTDIEASLDEDAPVVVLDAETGERIPYWVEADAHAPAEEVPVTFVRPAESLTEGHRIVVGVRNLVDVNGDDVEPTEAFRAYRDRLETDVPEVEARRDAMEAVFDDLAAAGVERDDLILAWDFTVASAESLAGPLLHIRDDAFATLGDAAPAFTVDVVEPSDREGIRTHVVGTYQVPLYLDQGGVPGSSLAVGDDGLPVQQGTYTANFECIVPESATASSLAMTGLYGHGLLGTAEQVNAAAKVAAAGNIVFCATDLIGMSESDVPNAAAIVADVSKFHTLADRLLQGHLDTLFLGRLLVHPDGLGTHPAFQDAGQSVLTDELVYYGISQGGIMGGATSAVAQDWTRAVLDVAAIDYGLLLDRSVDFDPFRDIMAPAYPMRADQVLGIQLIQMLWDRGEPDGYAQHLTTDPYEDTPAKQVLLHVAFGDHQVANVGSEVAARTYGLSVHRPVLAEDRGSAEEPFFGVPTIEEYPFDGSAAVMWDSGAAPPPDENLPPREGQDPHDDPRDTPEAIEQIVRFLTTGEVVDTCDGAPCQAIPQD